MFRETFLLVFVLSAGMTRAADEPLVAHWAFDEEKGAACVDASGNGNHASMARGGAIKRVAGLFGKAVSLSGAHQLNVPGKPDFSALKHISLSAWVMPTRFKGYNEIFRKEDGHNRVLFSFQENARILSLGLNINGYVECDASIRPEQVLDGRWHHCAATFDGRTMRVYLDGREIGSLARPGGITAGGGAPDALAR